MQQTEPVVGDLWREVDPRHEHWFLVVEVLDLQVRIRRALIGAGGKVVTRGRDAGKKWRPKWAPRRLFGNGRQGGYELVKRENLE